jgi:Domain of unknown function (DUF4382)
VVPTARHFRLAALVLATVALAACNGSLTVNLTDTPVDNATSVIVDFTGIELHNTNGQTVTFDFPSARQIDLLQLQNGATTALLQGRSVPSGSYDWIQLNVLAGQNTQGQSSITLATGLQYPLYIPSGSEGGLRLATGFTVAQGGTTELVIDFNLRQSVTGLASDGQNYALVPVLRLANQAQAGTITANVDLGALAIQQLGSGSQAAQCSGGVFVFAGSAATPQNGGGASLVGFEPIRSFGATTQASSLSIPYLPKGSYTVAATCDYGLYDPTAAPGQSGYQTLHWTVQDNVSVKANTTTTVTLPSGTTSSSVH